jgi:hypothetical protein
MHVSRTQSAALQITELIEHEQRMIAGAGVVPVPDAVLLLAMRRTHARIHVEHDASRRTTTMDDIDPPAGKISERQQVLFYREPARLEPAHLARRSCTALRGLTANNPTHCRIVAEAFGVVHVLISSETTEHRLPQ